MAASLVLDLTNSLSELERLHAEVDAFVEREGLEADLAFELNLALEEIVTNVISYGYEDAAEHHIAVRLVCDDASVTAVVEDDGRAFNPLERPMPDVGAPLMERPIGGLGIFLTVKMMDEVTYARRDGRNVLTMRKSVAPPAALAGPHL